MFSDPVRLMTLPLPETISAPELSPCDPIVRLVAANVAPFSTDKTPAPSSATVASPVRFRLVPAPVTVIRPTDEALPPASMEPTEALAPPLRDSSPEPATPTSNNPVTWRVEPGPDTSTRDPSAPAVLAITRPATPGTVDEAVQKAAAVDDVQRRGAGEEITYQIEDRQRIAVLGHRSEVEPVR
jgi:hypothetical protein